MKNSPFYSVILLLIIIASCRKDLPGNPITIEASTNDTLLSSGVRGDCKGGPPEIVLGAWNELEDMGNGEYEYEIQAGYEYDCFTILATIPANNDITGTTKADINAFYTEEGNVVGFQEIELKSPHDEYEIRYEFRVDTYLEE